MLTHLTDHLLFRPVFPFRINKFTFPPCMFTFGELAVCVPVKWTRPRVQASFRLTPSGALRTRKNGQPPEDFFPIEPSGWRTSRPKKTPCFLHPSVEPNWFYVWFDARSISLIFRSHNFSTMEYIIQVQNLFDGFIEWKRGQKKGLNWKFSNFQPLLTCASSSFKARAFRLPSSRPRKEFPF